MAAGQKDRKMTAVPPSPLPSDHPLALELQSLRSALAHFQNASHTSSIQLQHHSLESSVAVAKLRQLELVNLRLQEELAVLREQSLAPTTQGPHGQAAEFTLALRRLSARLEETERALQERIQMSMREDDDQLLLQQQIERLEGELERLKRKGKTTKERERELVEREERVHEERKALEKLAGDIVGTIGVFPEVPDQLLSDPASSELDAKLPSTPYSYEQVRSSLLKLLSESSAHTTRLESKLADALSALEAKDAEVGKAKMAMEESRERAARAETAVEMAKADDRAAAGLVERYMRFSQSTTDSLHKTISTLQSRHSATLQTLQLQLSQSQQSLKNEQRLTASLRSALDELTRDVVFHAQGRRREVSLRLALVGREEKWVGVLRRTLAGVARELQKLPSHGPEEPRAPQAKLLDKLMGSLRDLLWEVDGPTPDHEEKVYKAAAAAVSIPPGALARIVAAEQAVNSLVEELERETDRRMALEKKVAEADGADEVIREEVKTNGKPIAPPPEEEEQPEADERTTLLDEHEPTTLAPAPAPVVGVKLNGNAKADEDPVKSPAAVDANTLELPGHATVSYAAPAELERPITAPPLEQHVVESTHFESSAEPTTLPETVSTDTLASSSEMTPAPSVPTLSDESLLSETPTAVSHGALDELIANGEKLPPEDPKEKTIEPEAAVSVPEVVPVVVTDIPEQGIENPTPITAPPKIRFQVPDPEEPEKAIVKTAEEVYRDELLDRLSAAAARYEAVQQAFKACHNTLSELKDELMSPTSPGPVAEQASLLSTAVNRLDDITEDTRVSLEIRAIDDARIAKGFETLLMMNAPMGDDSRLHSEIEGFIAGQDPSGINVYHNFQQKLEDLEHDISIIKRAVHEWMTGEALTAGLSEEPPNAPDPSRPPPSPWGWTSAFLPSRPNSPSPTFGAVMTGAAGQGKPRSASNTMRFPTLAPLLPHEHPLAYLGLRHSMPSPAPSPRLSPPAFSPYGVISPPGSASSVGLGLPYERPRTTSAYMAGLAPGLGVRAAPPGRRQQVPIRTSSAPQLVLSSDDVE
ncbi:hypothetical protein CALCODRAFT_486233 [Calocera cornea HHB12733]|uniref:Uncharacterized protein n=1 Tax=Calocera cornea HHB12733 TaxID=1353952 RepID=A0A165DU55_9BASI|nr:hypothetical protein CALCODRAFT_486233 [Calocera cornea HHB12733]